MEHAPLSHPGLATPSLPISKQLDLGQMVVIFRERAAFHFPQKTFEERKENWVKKSGGKRKE